MKKMLDGWHTIAGNMVYVVNGVIIRGIKKDHNNSLVPAYVYRWSDKLHCWVSEISITPDSFRAGVKRGTVMLT